MRLKALFDFTEVDRYFYWFLVKKNTFLVCKCWVGGLINLFSILNKVQKDFALEKLRLRADRWHKICVRVTSCAVDHEE